MFKLYWVKQTAYAKKLAEMEKENDVIRDADTKRRFAKATSNSLEAKTRTPVLSGDVNARDVMSKLCEASISLGPHSMEIRIFIAKDARSEKSKAFAEISKVNNEASSFMGTSPAPESSAQPPSLTPQAPTAQSPGPSADPKPTKEASPSVPQQNQSSDPAGTTPKESATPNSPANSELSKNTEKLGSKSQGSPKPIASQEKEEKTVGPQPQPKPTQSNQETAKPTSDTPKNAPVSSGPPPTIAPTPSKSPSAVPPPPPSVQAANLQSIENTIMISNLNAIAKIDLSLNDLMKIVALGGASEAQITLFKKYIERAKQMGPQPHHADLYLTRGLPLPPHFPRPYAAKPFVPPKPAKPKIPNPMKLTAFQERYLHNATLVFEFLENPNVRYVIPRDSITEVLPPANPITLEDGAGVKDVLVSNIWIHNIEEVEIYEKKLAAYEAEQRKKAEEEEKKKKEEEEEQKRKEESQNNEETPSDGTNQQEEAPKPEVPAQRSSRSGKNRRPPPPKKKPKPLEPPVEPVVRYTTYSFTLHNIPEKFIPIVINSMRPLKSVQDKMERILKTGSRVSSFHLWYQVDARLDEGIAESLRQNLIQEEKKMTGVLPQGLDRERDQKKRRPREFKNPRAKKPKDDAPLSGTTPASAPAIKTE